MINSKKNAFKKYVEEILKDSFVEEDFEFDGEDFYYEGIMYEILTYEELDNKIDFYATELVSHIQRMLKTVDLATLIPYVDYDGYIENHLEVPEYSIITFNSGELFYIREL